MIRVMIVDDQELIREGLRTIISAHPELEVVAAPADGLAALRDLESLAVDVVLMDLRMPGIDGVETTRRIRAVRTAEQVRICVLTTFDQDENVLRALAAGADGFLGKGAGPTELTEGILSVAGGGSALSPTAISALVQHVSDGTRVPGDPTALALLDQLTAREREVVEAIVSGLDNQQIAERFVVSPHTVKTHANRAMAKVGVSDRAQLVTLAVRAGILPR